MENLQIGIYEQLINKLIYNKLNTVDKDQYLVKSTPLDKAEAARYLSQYLCNVIQFAFNQLGGDDKLIKQIDLSNAIIQTIILVLPNLELEANLIQSEGLILEAVFSKLNFAFSDFDDHIKKITPYTRLSQSELFTGSHAGISMDGELSKEIRSTDTIHWLVSFIRYSGIRIFREELEEFTENGGLLKIITTSYMGATEAKAIDFLAGLRNAEIKISYNVKHERLHAKAYLFLRNTGFHTGYIGSSNLSHSALTSGLEWNLKVTTRETPHIIDKFAKTFETYWADKEFEIYQPGKDKEKLRRALQTESSFGGSGMITFFDLKPYPFQEEILSKLNSERIIHNRFKNLLVAATGTGKTVISAFDYKRFKDQNPTARLLFVAHRKELLTQARDSFRHVLKDPNFGDLWVDGQVPTNYNYVFASVQTLKNNLSGLSLSSDFYDFIIVDEVHHISASSYRPILEKFSPQILLGLTATPERRDGADILTDFCGVIAAEIRLAEALNRKLLSPFQYFAVSDSIDLSKVSWVNGHYDKKELLNVYTESDRRVGDILKNCEKYLTDTSQVRAIGFCVNQDHAKYMARRFTQAGHKADFLTSDNPQIRNDIKHLMQEKLVNYLFVVDIFNEGIDLPEIDTVLFLRPTESLTIFLQQLGRGLRLADGKDCLTVLDFVGNSRSEYDFEHKFRALVGKTHTSIIKEIEDGFPHLPLGCSIILEEQASQIILENIKRATALVRNKLIEKIRNFRHHSNQDLTLRNFLQFNNLDLSIIYQRDSWSKLCKDAGITTNLGHPDGIELIKKVVKKLIQCNSYSYLSFIKRIISEDLSITALNENERLMALMFHYMVWNEAAVRSICKDLDGSVKQITKNTLLVAELIEVIDLLLDNVDFIESKISLGFGFPLEIHSRYTREQILIAIGDQTFERKSSNKEGVAYNKERNVEALFMTLKKSDKEYSPTTLYDDYAINESIFHSQSQNATSPESPKGISYIRHIEQGKQILLFVREQNEDEYGFTMGYVFLGDASYISSTGSRPMNINWRLETPMPAYLLNESTKLAVG